MNEQFDGGASVSEVGDVKGTDAILVLAIDFEGFPARRQHRWDLVQIQQEVHEFDDLIDDVLTVVEDQQQIPPGECGRSTINRGTISSQLTRRQPDRLRRCETDEGPVGDGCQVHEEHALGK